MKKKILITIGHKKREFEYILLLSSFLKKNNFDVCIMYANFEVYSKIFFWQPDIIILGQVNQNENIAVAKYASKSGVVVTVLNCEGIYDETSEIKIYGSKISAFVDYLFVWGVQHKKDALKSTDLSRDQVIITGTPKFDLYKLRHSIKKSSSKLRICIATSFSPADIEWKNISSNIAYKHLGERSILKMKNEHLQLRNEYISLAKEVLSIFKNVELKFRVHPLESIQVYVNELGKYRNIYIDNVETTVSLLENTDVLIHHRSTLATEAWMFNIPTATFTNKIFSQSYQKVFDKFDEVFFHKEDVIKWLKSKQFDQGKFETGRNEFLDRWYSFTSLKGLSSVRICNFLNKVNMKKKRRMINLFVIINIFLFVVMKIFGKTNVFEVVGMVKGKRYLDEVNKNYIFSHEANNNRSNFDQLQK